MWQVPREWEGETAFILGGGPSLVGVDVGSLRGRGPVIAINDAGLVVAPWADVHYFADRKWALWNRHELERFHGRHRVTRSSSKAPGLDVKVLAHDRRVALSHDRRRLAGQCGGANAINLAFLFGAARAVLFGFDMRQGSAWAARRPEQLADPYARRFIPSLRMMAAELAGRMGVVNATPGSALDCFPVMTPVEALAWSTSAS